MNWQSFISLIQSPSENVFFLSTTRQERLMGQIISGLLNTRGGKLIIGYDKINVHLTGYEQTDQWIDQYLNNHFKLSQISTTFLFRSNKKILILDIEASKQVMPYSNKYYTIIENKITEYTPEASQSTTPFPTENQSSIPPTMAPKSQPRPQLTEEKPITASTYTPNNEIDSPTASFNARQLNAMEFITKQGSIKNKQYRKLFEVSHKTAHIELAELVQQKKVIIAGSGRSTCYRLPSETESTQKKGITRKIDAAIPQQLLESFLAKHQHINESMYADEFNMDLAQAINELQHFCEHGILEKTVLNNETCYMKASQLSLI